MPNHPTIGAAGTLRDIMRANPDGSPVAVAFQEVLYFA
jgi:hypothetical protein